VDVTSFLEFSFYAERTHSGNLNLLEPSEPVQACNGIALPFINTRNLRYLHFPLLHIKSLPFLSGSFLDMELLNNLKCDIWMAKNVTTWHVSPCILVHD
jgi:hypothetical protein